MEHIADLLSHPKVLETRDHIHHRIPKHDHLLRSVKYSSRFARLLRADERVCMRAAIVSHMYPLGPAPTTREGWVLVLADKAASLGDLKQYLRGLVDGTSQQTHRRLQLSDPYYHPRPRRTRQLLRRRAAS